MALALIPTIIHSYAGGMVVDGRLAATIPALLAGYSSVPSGRNATWGKRRFDSDDWIERNYSASGRPTIRLTVIRSLDAKSVYHHPELAVEDRASFVGERIRRFPERPDIPVHVLEPGQATRAAAMYALHYDDRFVENPILFQVRTAGELLFRPRQPMTLFFVLDSTAGQSGEQGGEVEPEGSRQVLLAAIDAFLQQERITTAR